MTNEARLKIIKRDKEKCFLCGSIKELEVHHIVPKWINGDEQYQNLITLCFKCHRTKIQHYKDIKSNNLFKKCIEYTKQFKTPKNWEKLLIEKNNEYESEFKKVVGITLDDYLYIDGIKHKKSKAGMLKEIIKFYKLNQKND